MDWNPQCKPKPFDTFAKSQLKVKKEGFIMAEMEASTHVSGNPTLLANHDAREGLSHSPPAN
jgi:hypothetical protein